MRKVRFVLATAIALAWAGYVSAQAAISDPEAALFGARERAAGLDISPNGKLISYVAPTRGGGAVALVADVETGASKAFLSTGNGPEHLSWCRFVTDARLVCQYTAIAKGGGPLTGFTLWL